MNRANEGSEGPSGKSVSAVAGLIAVASVSRGAQAQQSNLPPVTVDAPVERPRPVASKPTPEQVRAATRFAAPRSGSRRPSRPLPPHRPAPWIGNPYADPAAPYKVDHVQASGKFPEPMLNTPKTITVLSKEVLEDKNATTLKEIGRSTAGVTLGSGEGGNAFGDRFFIRGFDARNDVFIDGIRDPAVSIRENFFTEQIEILRGPASSYAGRGTAGGAINIVTKQAGDVNFKRMDTEFGTDRTKRVTLDVNQVVDPTFSVRAGGLFQDANVAGRNYVTDDRWGSFISTKYTPTNDIKITTNYVHTDLSGYPDFGVPYYKQGNVPVTSAGIPRENWYGFLNRDFQTARQDFGTGTIEYKVNEAITLSSKVRGEHSLLNYIGTLPQGPEHDQPQSAALDDDGERAEPLPERGRVGQPERGHVQARHRRGQAHRGVRRRICEREHLDRPLRRPRVGTGRQPRFTSTGASRGSISTPRSTPIFRFGTPSLDRKPDPLRRQHQQRVCHGHRELAGHHHRQWRHPLRRLQHELVDQRAELSENERRSRQLQRRRGLQADVDRQHLRGLCDLGQSVRIGA